MIEQYIYAVTKELPEKIRDDIGREIRVLIEDMMEGMDSTLSESEKIERVLLELGDPKEFAARYKEHERYLIGPAYFDEYLFVLKIVGITLLIVATVLLGIDTFFSDKTIVEIIIDYLVTLFGVMLQGLAWVTVIFAVMEMNQVVLESETKAGNWDPKQLPVLPHKKAIISRGDTIASIIVSSIFLPLVFFAPEVIGIYSFTHPTQAEWDFTPFFNLEVISSFKLLVFIIFTLNITIELIKLIKGRWTKRIAITTSVLNVLASGMLIYILTNRTIWSSQIEQALVQYSPISLEQIILIIVASIVAITIYEVATALYKGFKYDDVI